MGREPDIPRGAARTQIERRKRAKYRRWLAHKTTLPGIIHAQALLAWADTGPTRHIPCKQLRGAFAAGFFLVVGLFVWALIRAYL